MPTDYTIQGGGRYGRNRFGAATACPPFFELHVSEEGVYLDTPWRGFRFRREEVICFQWQRGLFGITKFFRNAVCRIVHSKPEYPNWISFGSWSVSEMEDLRRHLEEFGYQVCDT